MPIADRRAQADIRYVAVDQRAAAEVINNDSSAKPLSQVVPASHLNQCNFRESSSGTLRFSTT